MWSARGEEGGPGMVGIDGNVRGSVCARGRPWRASMSRMESSRGADAGWSGACRGGNGQAKARACSVGLGQATGQGERGLARGTLGLA